MDVISVERIGIITAIIIIVITGTDWFVAVMIRVVHLMLVLVLVVVLLVMIVILIGFRCRRCVSTSFFTCC